MPAGRPTKYRPEFCNMLADHMAEGFSFESFAGHEDVLVNVDTLYEWVKKHEEFAEAKKLAFSRNRLSWERIMFAGDMHPTLAIFNMKNRFPKEWRDRKEIAEDPKEVTVTHQVSEEVSQQTNALVEILKEWKK